MVAAALLIYVALIGHTYFGLIRIAIFPGCAPCMLGSTRGLFVTLIQRALLAALLRVRAPSWQPAEFGLAAAFNLTAALACLTLQVYFYERRRQEVFGVLEAKRREYERLSNTDSLTVCPIGCG